MKKILIMMLSVAVMAFAMSCQDAEQNPQFNKSKTDITVVSSAASVSLAPADSLSNAVTLTWNDPAYSTGLDNSKFTILISPSENNFASFVTKAVTGSLETSFTGREINKIAIKLGGIMGQPMALDVKVISSLINNSEPKNSNVIKVTVTPYSDFVLKSSATEVVTQAESAAQTGLTLTWNIPFKGYEGTRTYQFQYAKGGTNFATPTVAAITSYSKSYTHLELNNMAALQFGVLAGEVGNVDFRIKATNGLGTETFSNVITVAITPYSSKPVPKYPVPAELYLVGDATPGNWSNPVPTPSQKFTKIDDNTFGLIIQLTGGKSYLALPVNGDWSHKYNPPTSGENPAGDAFAPDAGSNNIPAPAADGLYKIVIDFVAGTYTTTLISNPSDNPIPANLYIVGDATAGSWSNPVPTPSQQFTQISNGEFELTIDLTAAKSYLFLPLNGDWGHKFGGTSKTGSDLLADGAVPGSNTPSPDVTGTYTINVNFLSQKYTVK